MIWTGAAFGDVLAATLRSPSTRAGESLADALFDAAASLGQLPHSGHELEAGGGHVRDLLCRQFRLFHRVNDDAATITILRVWHSARHGVPRLRGDVDSARKHARSLRNSDSYGVGGRR